MGQGFETTDWTLVRTARAGDDQGAQAALARLCGNYWLPLYAYVRHLGHSPDDAADLVQGFFTALLEKDYLKQVDPEAGRFRTFMLSSLKNYLANERAKQRTQKRGGDTVMVPLDSRHAERLAKSDSFDAATPEDVFHRRWARTVVDRALARLQEERAAVGKAQEFELLSSHLTGEEPHTPYRELAARLGTTEGALRVAVHRLRTQFGEILRHEIRQTVLRPQDIDREVRELLSTLGVVELAS
ncbi:MAG: sigma-70 family RNA polymerase sigma factor [Thermoanaerobaculia bacterium]|nr:sigma-70 family RNA polymerase sigma factor [Thermoanaerobaculia bacterium]